MLNCCYAPRALQCSLQVLLFCRCSRSLLLKCPVLKLLLLSRGALLQVLLRISCRLLACHGRGLCIDAKLRGRDLYIDAKL